MLLKQRFLTVLILDTLCLLFTVIISWSKVYEISLIQHAQRSRSLYELAGLTTIHNCSHFPKELS